MQITFNIDDELVEKVIKLGSIDECYGVPATADEFQTMQLATTLLVAIEKKSTCMDVSRYVENYLKLVGKN